MLDKFTSQFEGRSITTIVYRGKPCWIAYEIGGILDYAWEGKRLATRISGEWGNEFEPDNHYVILKGVELAEFKQLLELSAESVPSPIRKRTTNLMLIYEPGLHLVAVKANKPIGVRLYNFLTSEVLPQIVR